ncbi:MAG: tyrosine-type recombinase/integrase [Candidatus Sulfotelmatobacter sp.]
MSTAPVITIFVRHSPGCKYAGDEFCKRCSCRKHLRWTQNGKQYRRKAGTRSWGEAEEQKRRLEDQLAGRKPEVDAGDKRTPVEDAVRLFMEAKRNDGLEPPSLAKLQKTVDRIQAFCEESGLFCLEDVDLTHVTTWPWTNFLKTTHALRNNQSRVKSFFRYFENAGVLPKNPTKAWKSIKGKTEQASGFTAEEYKAILKAVPLCGWPKETEAKMRALVQLMRYAGLAMVDACCLERSQIRHAKGQYRIQLRSRQKTSKKAHLQPIDNVVPPNVGKEVMAVLNGNPRYVFWNFAGDGPASDEQKRAVSEKYFQRYMRTLLDKAGLPNATSHKFRHTLAIEMIRHGASFEDVAATLGNTVAVVAKFYSHEWGKVRQHRTDSAIKAAW